MAATAFVAMLPVLVVAAADALERVAGVNVLGVLGTDATWSRRKADACIAWIVVVAIGAGVSACANAATRWRRSLGCALAIFAIAVSEGALVDRLSRPDPTAIANALSGARVFNVPHLASGVVPKSAQSHRSFTGFVVAVDSAYLIDSAAVRKALPSLSAPVRRALYLQDVVSGLWHFGNRERTTDTGCIIRNEQRTEALAVGRLRFDDYGDSDIACCSDFALWLAALGRREGWDVAVVVLPGHVLLEVRIDGQRWYLDPSANIAMRQGATGRRAGVEVFVLPKTDLALGAAPGRTAVQELRTYLVAVAAAGGSTLSRAPRTRGVPGYERVDLSALR